MSFNVIRRRTLNHLALLTASLETPAKGEAKKIGDITLVPQPTDSSHDPLNWLVALGTHELRIYK